MSDPSASRATAADLRRVVEFIADAHEVATQDVDLAAGLGRFSRTQTPADAIRHLAAEVGLTTALVWRPLADVIVDADPSYPWFAIRFGESGHLEAIAIERAARGGAYVSVPGKSHEPSRWSMASLRRWLGVTDTATAVEWILAEPAAPLSLMRAREGEAPPTPFVRLRALLAGERRTLWVALIYSVVIGLLTLVLPIAVQSLVNTVAFGSALQPLVVLTLFVLLALGFSTVMNAARAGVVEIVQRSIFARVATDVTWRLLRVKAEAFDRYHGPELVNRFFDTVTVQKSAALLLIDGLSIVMQTVIGMLLLAFYHPLLLAFDVVLVLAMLMIVLLLGRGAVTTSISESKAKYALEAWLEQLAANLVTFKSSGGPEYAVRRSQGLLEDYLTYRAKHFKILLRQIVGSFALQAMASAALLGVGGWLVIARQLTLGQLVAAELLVSGMLSAFTKFGKQLEVFYDLCAAIDKLGLLIDLPLERSGGEAEPQSTRPMTLSMRNLEVRHADGGVPALSLAAWDVASGVRIGLTGPTGSGKSTLADVIFGLRPPTMGIVRVDGVDLRAVPLASLRRDVALVRNVELFPGSVFDNVRLGRDHLSYDDVCKALSDVGVLDELLSLPKGLETILQPHSRPLSDRQASRLMIARAIVDRPRLLILDGTLDQIGRGDELLRVTETLFAREAPWTLICMSERVELLARCDQVVTLRDGAMQAVDEIGTVGK
jgi:putative ABC transport system ATP-binding protein